MAAFPVNITISRGSTYSQTFFLTNPDMTPVNLEGSTFSANLAKHSMSQDALAEDGTIYKFIPLTTSVVDASKGSYSISLTPEQTGNLEEGKYVYSVSMMNTQGVISETISGLAFVDNALGNMR